MTTFAKALAAARPDEIAVRDEIRALGWAELDDVLNRIANGLNALDLGPDRRIAVFAENAVETALANLGGLIGGARRAAVRWTGAWLGISANASSKAVPWLVGIPFRVRMARTVGKIREPKKRLGAICGLKPHCRDMICLAARLQDTACGPREGVELAATAGNGRRFCFDTCMS